MKIVRGQMCIRLRSWREQSSNVKSIIIATKIKHPALNTCRVAAAQCICTRRRVAVIAASGISAFGHLLNKQRLPITSLA